MNIAAELAPTAAALPHHEPNFYLIGSKTGRAPTFLLAAGCAQARSVVAIVAGDHKAALRVELELPETGGCNSNPNVDTAGGCCAPGSQGCRYRPR